MWNWVSGICGLCLLACGGAVDHDQIKENGEPDESAEPGEPAPPDDPSPSTPLGACMAGFDRYEEPDRDCNWYADHLCYEDKLDACSCICPSGTKVTTCSSGFPQKDGAVEVYCS
jgi:hypothetical protein